MSITKLHWLIKERYNKLDSNHYRDLTPLQLDEAINKATYDFMERNVFIEDQPRFDMISDLIITSPDQPAIAYHTVSNDVYEFRLADLKYPYYHYKRAHVTTDCGLTKVEIVGHGRLSDILTDSMQKPSKKWRRLIGTIAKTSDGEGKSLYIYATPDWTIDTLFIEYVKKPSKVFFGGYDSIEYIECLNNNGVTCSQYYNTSTDPVDLEIDETYHTLIADYAVLELTRTLKDVPGFQLRSNSITT